MANSLRVVVAAAGIGSRMNSSVNKQYMLIRGRPVLAYSLDVFEQSDLVDSIVVVANSTELEYCQNQIVKKYGYKKVIGTIAGGKERQDSVWAGLNFAAAGNDFIAIHDGARPLVTARLLANLLDQAQKYGAAVPGVLARDTLKTIDDEGFVVDTLDRSKIAAVQTPQIFRYDSLLKAYQMAYAEGKYGTDDASLFEKYIGRVKIVQSDSRNIKITTPEDIAVAESLLEFLG